MREYICKYISGKGLILKIYKELKQLNKKRKHDLILKWAKDLNGHLSKDIQMSIYKKICSTSLIYRKMPIKTIILYCHNLAEWPL